jgi:predicted Rossmann-fold nucleotide-binding protein
LCEEKVRDFPLILFGSAYWDGLLTWLRETMLAAHNVTSRNLDLLMVTDSPEDACRRIVEQTGNE